MMRCVRNGGVLLGVPRALRRPETLRATRVAPVVRCLASKRDKEIKTWEEIAEEAGELAKNVVQKIFQTGQEIIKRSGGSGKGAEKAKRGGSLYRPGDFFGELMGRRMGEWMGAMFKGVSEQMMEMQSQTRGVYDVAADRVRNSQRVRSTYNLPRLGSISCGDPFSQSTSSQSINGVITKRTLLEFPISGERGNGRVRVEATEQPGGKQDMRIQVQLASGQMIRLDNDQGDGSGRTIDVEWKDV